MIPAVQEEAFWDAKDNSQTTTKQAGVGGEN